MYEDVAIRGDLATLRCCLRYHCFRDLKLLKCLHRCSLEVLRWLWDEAGCRVTTWEEALGAAALSRFHAGEVVQWLQQKRQEESRAAEEAAASASASSR